MASKIKYLYIHKFDWLNPNGDVDFKGEPKKGGVYRAEDHKKYYLVSLSKNQEYIGFRLEKDLMVGEYDAWECDVEEITIDNLFDFNISNNDLEMMAENTVLDNLDFSEEDRMEQILGDLGSSMYMLHEFDNDIYEAVAKVTTMISDALSQPAYVPLMDGLSWDARTAKTTNIAVASHLLESYLNAKNPLEIKDLIDSIYYLMLEAARTHKIAKLNAQVNNV